MQEDRPFLPREIERALEFLDVGHHPEAALGVGVIERIRDGRRRFHRPRFAAGGDFQKGFGRLSGKALGQEQEAVFGGLAHVLQPLCRHAVAQQLILGRFGEEGRLGGQGDFRLHIDRDNDLLHRLADFHQLRGSGLRMGFQLPPLGPVVGFVMVTHEAEQQAALRSVNDEPDVRAHAHRPEVLVLRLFELVEGQARTGGIHLQIKGRGLDGFLLVTGQPCEAVGEGIGDAEVHGHSGQSFSRPSRRSITSGETAKRLAGGLQR